VLNKEITSTLNISTHNIHPGRALLLETNWHADQKLTILVIYAPNPPNENRDFWVELHDKWETQNLPKPDIMLGDFNIVEDSIDRLPCHPDNHNAVEALQDLKALLHLEEGWRKANPTTKAFTYMQKSTSSQSRIDRIYTTSQLFKHSYKWSMENTGIPTDHKMISVVVASPSLPYIGKGRWMIPTNLLKNKEVHTIL
jgi:endonuclease/exonuclease/phosphatase family metal-dependent hydrolase